MMIRLLAVLWCWWLTFAERKGTVAVLALATLAVSLPLGVRADCAGARVDEVRAAFVEAQRLERAGETSQALDAYVRAQSATCDANPVATDAAERAAALARPLAQRAESEGRLEQAVAYWESGGHFAQADRALMEFVRERPDDVGLFDRARAHFSNRALPSFAVNNQARIAVTGAYAFDPSLASELADMPAERAGRALADEARHFDESYLRAVVELEGRKAAAASDIAGMSAAAAAHQQLAQRWPEDPLEASRAALRSARTWASRDTDASRSRGLETRIDLRYADRANALVRGYSAAPALLEAAMDYFRESVPDATLVESDLAGVRQLALRLAEQSAAAGKDLAAADYYDVAGETDKAELARERQGQMAQQAMAPQLEAAQRQALELARAYATPEQAEALQRQVAEAMEAYRKASAGTAERPTEM
jgi:hypothetical protein